MAGTDDAVGGFVSGLASGAETPASGQSNLGSFVGRKLGIAPGSGSNLSRWLGSKFGSNASGGSKAAGDASDNATTMKKGGRVKKTGMYRVHKGEVIIPAKVVKAIDKVARGKRKMARKSSRASGRR